MTYVDGTICSVKTDRKDDYVAFSHKAAEIFKDHGALSVVECWGDDVPDGKVTSMNSAVLREPDEVVVFSWITWPSKEARDKGWEKSMADPRMPQDMAEMPFDGKRMIFGGFNMIVEA